ncbi:hypothetical protein Efla_006767 [Eimeria flavescens]
MPSLLNFQEGSCIPEAFDFEDPKQSRHSGNAERGNASTSCLSPPADTKGLRRGFLECHICLLRRKGQSRHKSLASYTFVKPARTEPACTHHSHKLHTSSCKFDTSTTKDDKFLVLQPSSTAAVNGVSENCRPRCWEVSSVAYEGASPQHRQDLPEPHSQGHNEQPLWENVINSVACWLAVDRLNATILVLGGRGAKRWDTIIPAQARASGVTWVPCVAQRACVKAFSLAALKGNYSMRTRVSCWLLSVQGTVDLLAPLCCLLRPSCPGCYFALTPEQKHDRQPAARQAKRNLFTSPPISAFEACRLIQTAKDRMEEIKGNFDDAPTLFVRLQFLQEQAGGAYDTSAFAGAPVLHVVFFCGYTKRHLSCAPSPAEEDEKLEGAQDADCWATRGPLSLLCALLGGLFDDKSTSERPAKLPHMTQHSEKAKESVDGPLYMHSEHCTCAGRNPQLPQAIESLQGQLLSHEHHKQLLHLVAPLLLFRSRTFVLCYLWRTTRNSKRVAAFLDCMQRAMQHAPSFDLSPEFRALDRASTCQANNQNRIHSTACGSSSQELAYNPFQDVTPSANSSSGSQTEGEVKEGSPAGESDSALSIRSCRMLSSGSTPQMQSGKSLDSERTPSRNTSTSLIMCPRGKLGDIQVVAGNKGHSRIHIKHCKSARVQHETTTHSVKDLHQASSVHTRIHLPLCAEQERALSTHAGKPPSSAALPHYGAPNQTAQDKSQEKVFDATRGQPSRKGANALASSNTQEVTDAPGRFGAASSWDAPLETITLKTHTCIIHYSHGVRTASLRGYPLEHRKVTGTYFTTAKVRNELLCCNPDLDIKATEPDVSSACSGSEPFLRLLDGALLVNAETECVHEAPCDPVTGETPSARREAELLAHLSNPESSAEKAGDRLNVNTLAFGRDGFTGALVTASVATKGLVSTAALATLVKQAGDMSTQSGQTQKESADGLGSPTVAGGALSNTTSTSGHERTPPSATCEAPSKALLSESPCRPLPLHQPLSIEKHGSKIHQKSFFCSSGGKAYRCGSHKQSRNGSAPSTVCNVTTAVAVGPSVKSKISHIQARKKLLLKKLHFSDEPENSSSAAHTFSEEQSRQTVSQARQGPADGQPTSLVPKRTGNKGMAALVNQPNQDVEELEEQLHLHFLDDRLRSIQGRRHLSSTRSRTSGAQETLAKQQEAAAKALLQAQRDMNLRKSHQRQSQDKGPHQAKTLLHGNIPLSVGSILLASYAMTMHEAMKSSTGA